MTAVVQLVRAVWRAAPVKLSVAIGCALMSALTLPALAVLSRIMLVRFAGHEDVPFALTAAFSSVLIAAISLQHFSYYPMIESVEGLHIDLQSRLIRLASVTSDGPELTTSKEWLEVSQLRRELGSLAGGVSGLLSTLASLVSLSISVALLATLTPLMLVLPLVALPQAICMWWTERRLVEVSHTGEASARVAARLLSTVCDVNTVKEVQLWGWGAALAAKHDKLCRASTQPVVRVSARGTLLKGLSQLAYYAILATLLLYVVSSEIGKGALVGNVVLVILLSSQVSQQMSGVLQSTQQLQKACHLVRRINLLEPETPWARAPYSSGRVSSASGPGLRVQDVSFSYPSSSRQSLREITFQCPPGSVVAIVGENGAGKSTLVRVLSGLLSPSAGRVEWDGARIDASPLSVWRSRVSVGLQDFKRFEARVSELIGMGEVAHIRDAERIQVATQEAGAREVVDMLPDRWFTHVGKTFLDGISLSGGQWQRIVFARAMMRRSPALVILDEPTSALDADQEDALLTQYIASARRLGSLYGTVTVVVTHRLSVVHDVDQVLMFDAGRLVGMGSHSGLMESCLGYSELYNLQAAQYR